MIRKILLYCGIAAPILYGVTVIVGAAMRNDYSHIINAISELISYGAPNKAILDVIFNIYGALLLAFAIGGYIALKNTPRLCRIAMAAAGWMQAAGSGFSAYCCWKLSGPTGIFLASTSFPNCSLTAPNL